MTAASALRRRFHHPSGDVDVLRGLDLSVGAGEIVTVAGRSGSGKNALLALLGGFDSPDSGRVLLAGEPVDGAPPWHLCAVLPQALGLAGELTVAENVALPLRLRPGTDVVEERVTTLLDELGIAHLADRYPAEVSFGQRQRVAPASAADRRTHRASRRREHPGGVAAAAPVRR